MPVLSIREALQLVLDCPDCGGRGRAGTHRAPIRDGSGGYECICRFQARDALEANADADELWGQLVYEVGPDEGPTVHALSTAEILMSGLPQAGACAHPTSDVRVERKAATLTEAIRAALALARETSR